jgi:predicted adenine nucleotide alpha hydrolase (AANH) superfamily ATPase
MKLLLHTCCAPCSIQCVKTLAGEGIDLELFWYNPNIHPYTEYRSRRDSLAVFAGDKALLLTIEDEYGLRPFIKSVSSIEEDPGDNKRCGFCYRLRLEKTVRFAAEKGCDAFSTTLLISPYQNHELLKEVGEELAVLYKVQFLYRDFRPGFREGQREAREVGYYMQKYCGCIYSEEERYLGGRKA